LASRGKSPIEGMLTLVARAPWPVGVVLAVVSFTVFNKIAHGEPIQAAATADMSRSVLTNLGITLAGVAHYLLPSIFLVAALASLSGIPQATISAIENERVKLGAERAKVLARALKCHPAVLLFPGWDVEEHSAA